MPYLEIAYNLPIHSTYSYFSDRPVDPGCRVQAQLGKRKMTGWVVNCSDEAPTGLKHIKTIARVVDKSSLFVEDTLPLARWMSDLTLCSLGEALSSMIPGGRRESHDNTDDSDGLPEIRQLSESQSQALRSVFDDLTGWFYLYGGTGSGKTEVFLRAAEKVLSLGRTVIYLVPEIALSHHLIESISQRFKNTIAVLHSGLSVSRRLTEWRKAQSGRARFVLGVRSAVFAPLRDLGLVIIDEEHESSYKSSNTPRYHARQIAMHRCRDSNAALIMGSATPSVEAWELMSRGGLKGLEIHGRPGGGAPPELRLVDMNRESGLLAQDTVRSLARVLNSGRQALLFLNRRGFSYNYVCPDCGEEILCRNCSVAMTYHKNRSTMICHYCGHRQMPPQICPSCSSIQIKASGFGTEKIEEDMNNLFPGKCIVRLDADTARRKGVLAETLKKFRDGDIDVLLGTQMVAKGLNTPGLKLAVILSADSSLNLPDFRAAERSFALIVQVAGRVGRFAPDGEVIIQSRRPQTYPVRLAALNRIQEFYEYEIEKRRQLGFPPFSRLFRIVARGKKEIKINQLLHSLTEALQSPRGEWNILGPAECPIGMISGEYRQHIIIRSNNFDQCHALLSETISQLPKIHGIRLEIDIDPVNLL